jgi:hypothetical protein
LWKGDNDDDDDDDDDDNVTPLDYTTHTAKKMDHILQKIWKNTRMLLTERNILSAQT